MKKPKFIIWAPPFRHNSAGVHVLHRLCHLLNEYGHEAYITTSETKPGYNTPKAQRYDVLTDIVIYPETVGGNISPLCERNTIRYILNSPYTWGGDMGYKYKRSDLLVFYDWEFLDNYPKDVYYEESLEKAIKLKISTIDPGLFYTDKSQKIKDKKVIYFGKLESALEHFNLKDKEKYTIILRDSTKSHEETAEILRSAEEYYSFDPQSSMNVEAVYCGCDSYIILESGQYKYKLPNDMNTPAKNKEMYTAKKRIKDFTDYVYEYFGF